jgi:hypothetical protein
MLKEKTRLKKRTNKPRSKDDAHYVDNKEFLQAFIIYHEKYIKSKAEGKPTPKLPDYIGICFINIANRFSHHASFVNYPYRDEMIADAIENCVMYAHDFDPNRGTNPFAYFTQVVWHAFIRRINKENKNKYITYKSHQMQSIYSGLSDGEVGGISEDGSSTSHKPQDLYENITSYIDDYEQKAKQKRIEKKKRLSAANNAKMKK